MERRSGLGLGRRVGGARHARAAKEREQAAAGTDGVRRGGVAREVGIDDLLCVRAGTGWRLGRERRGGCLPCRACVCFALVGRLAC